MAGDHLAITRYQNRHGPTKLSHAAGDPGHLVGAMGLGIASIRAQPIQRPELDALRCET